jgi:hypothetical protein
MDKVPLIDEDTGALNMEWVYQHRKETGVGLTEAFRDGMRKYTEFHQKMMDFQKKFLEDPDAMLLQYDAFCVGAGAMDSRRETK